MRLEIYQIHFSIVVQGKFDWYLTMQRQNSYSAQDIFL